MGKIHHSILKGEDLTMLFICHAPALGTGRTSLVMISLPRPDPKHRISSKRSFGLKAPMIHLDFHFSISHMNSVSNCRGRSLNKNISLTSWDLFRVTIFNIQQPKLRNKHHIKLDNISPPLPVGFDPSRASWCS